MEKNVVAAQAGTCCNSETDNDITDIAALPIDKTAWNATNSPLLRLPAELRQQIWSLYINSTVINVDGPNGPGYVVPFEHYWNPFIKSHVFRPPPTLPYHLTFRTCGPLTDTTRCHIEPQTPEDPHPWDKCKSAHRVYHPLVCKQFWYETYDLFMKRATWIFHSHHDLVLFIKTKKSVLPHVRRIVIYDATAQAMPLGRWIDSWQQALTWSKMRHFTRLEGVEMHIWLSIWPNTLRTVMSANHDPLTHSPKLRGIMRSLQQHRLRPDLTSVRLYPSCYDERNRERLTKEVEAWAGAWRYALLTHVPLGEGAGCNEKKWAGNHRKDEQKEV